MAVYWKNDSLHPLLPNTIGSSAESIAFNGNDMYIGCSNQYTGNYIAYWKNGIGVNVTSQKFTQIDYMQVATSNNNVYFAGLAQTTPNGVRTPAYWKNNDSFSIIPLVYFLQPNYITCLTIAGNDVYIGGSSTLPPPSLYTTYGAAYWKNGTPVYLNNDDTITSTSTVNALVISNADVYAAGTTREVGYTIEHALYWKNGKLIQLDTVYSIVNAIAVHKGNVYAEGTRGYETAAYWKHGSMKLLKRGHIYAMAIKGK